MSIQELWGKFKGFIIRPDAVLAVLIITVSAASFFLGRYSVLEKGSEIQSVTQPAQIIMTQDASTSTLQAPVAEERKSAIENASSASTIPIKGAYLGSKTGAKYHLPWCAGAKQIKESNKVWFATKADAEKAGYSPASNCKGI